MDNRVYKVVAGLALENEIYNGRSNQRLFNIYSSPSFDAIKALHDQLIASDDHFDREVAFWLELALQQMPIKINLQDLIAEMREMEVLLSDLLWRVDADSQRDLNDWLNYIANVHQSIQDGHGVDAKILMSLAVQSCRGGSVERVKRDLGLRYRVEVLQRETLRLYEEIRRFPLKLTVPEERLDALIELQGVLIDLLRRYYLEQPGKEFGDLIRYPIQKLQASQRYLMRSDIKTDKAKQEIELASEHLEWQTNNITDKKTLEWAKDLRGKIKILISHLE